MSAENSGEMKIPKEVKDLWDKMKIDEIVEKTNWFTMKYAENKRDLVFDSSGETGIAKAKEILLLSKDQVVFMVFRGLHVTKQVKMITLLIVWFPERIRGFERGKVCIEIDSVARKVGLENHVLIQCSSPHELDEAEIVKKIKETTKTSGNYIVKDNIYTIRLKNMLDQAEAEEKKKKKTKQKKNIFKEILTTEQEYVRSMKIFHEVYLRIPLKKFVICQKALSEIEPHVGTILDINKEFLEKLEGCYMITEEEKEESARKEKELQRLYNSIIASRVYCRKNNNQTTTTTTTIKEEGEEEEGEKEEVEGEVEEEEGEGEDDRNKIKEIQVPGVNRDDISKMVDVLIEQCPKFKEGYLPYINRYNDVLDKFNELKKPPAPSPSSVRNSLRGISRPVSVGMMMNQREEERKKLRAYLECVENSLKNVGTRSTSFGAYLIKPIQRITRYHLLNKDLLKRTHVDDPVYQRILEGKNTVVNMARYVDSKQNEFEMRKKTVEIAREFRMNALLSDLDNERRKMVSLSKCTWKQKRDSDLCIFNDLIIICNLSSRKKKRILFDENVRCYPDPKNKKCVVIETQNKKHKVILVKQEDTFDVIGTIRHCLLNTVGTSKSASRDVYSSYLRKPGANTGRMKKRYYVLSADMKMRYFLNDSEASKMKSSFSLDRSTIVGKGFPETEKRRCGWVKRRSGMGLVSSSEGNTVDYNCWMYITTIENKKRKRRTRCLVADNVRLWEDWVRILHCIGCRRKDIVPPSVRQWQEKFSKKLEVFRGIKEVVQQQREIEEEEEEGEEEKRVKASIDPSDSTSKKVNTAPQEEFIDPQITTNENESNPPPSIEDFASLDDMLDEMEIEFKNEDDIDVNDNDEVDDEVDVDDFLANCGKEQEISVLKKEMEKMKKENEEKMKKMEMEIEGRMKIIHFEENKIHIEMLEEQHKVKLEEVRGELQNSIDQTLEESKKLREEMEEQHKVKLEEVRVELQNSIDQMLEESKKLREEMEVQKKEIEERTELHQAQELLMARLREVDSEQRNSIDSITNQLEEARKQKEEMEEEKMREALMHKKRVENLVKEKLKTKERLKRAVTLMKQLRIRNKELENVKKN